MKEKPNYIKELECALNKKDNNILLKTISTYVYSDDDKSFVINSYTPYMMNIYKVYKCLIENGYDVSCVIINVGEYENTIGITNIDYKYIKYINNYVTKNNLNTKIFFEYDSSSEAEYEDYMLMIDSLKWYRCMINDSQLTPVEKLTFAYDLAKLFKYNSSDNIGNDNTLHLIFKTGNIVCLGYNRFMMAILNGIDRNVYYSDFETICYDEKGGEPEYHSRGIVRIDDDEYDIHGIYICDPTWDSIDLRKEDYYGDKYDAFSGYRYFMVPIYKYRRFFKGDTYPRLFNGKLKGYEKRLTNKKLDEIIRNPNVLNDLVCKMNCINYKEFDKLFLDHMTYKEFLRYLNCKRPDSDKFLNIILRVRHFEGYNVDDMNNILVYGIEEDDKDHGLVIEIVDNSKEKQLVL